MLKFASKQSFNSDHKPLPHRNMFGEAVVLKDG